MNVMVDGNGKFTLILAHGAGAGMDSPFLQSFSAALAKLGVRVVRFEFPYMELIRLTGKRRPPNKMQQLLNRFIDVIEAEGDCEHLFIGGKSLGGRVATVLLTDIEAAVQLKARNIHGCICLGYPFHPPGKPEKLRTEHLYKLAHPLHIVQGEKDPFGSLQDIQGYQLPKGISIDYVEGGNHDLKSARKYGVAHEEQISRAAHSVYMFMKSVAL